MKSKGTSLIVLLLFVIVAMFVVTRIGEGQTPMCAIGVPNAVCVTPTPAE